jgi:hypothetical protein
MYEGTLSHFTPRVRKIKQSTFLCSCDMERDGRKTNVCGILVGKREARTSLGRHKRKDNINMDLREREDRMIWTGLL